MHGKRQRKQQTEAADMMTINKDACIGDGNNFRSQKSELSVSGIIHKFVSSFARKVCRLGDTDYPFLYPPV